MQRQGILVLRDRDMRQEPGRGHGLGKGLRRERCGLDAQLAMGAGVFFPHVPKDPHLCRDDIELLGDLLSDLDEPLAIVGADPLFRRELVYHIDSRERFRQRLSSGSNALMGRNGDDCWFRTGGRRGFGLVEEPELIGREFFAATPEALGDEEVDLFLEGLKPGLLALGLAGQSRDLAVFLREEGEDLLSVRREFKHLA